MKVSRRGFLKVSGATASLALVSRFGMDKLYAGQKVKEFKIKHAKESTTICPYCAVGCGQIVSARDGKVINIEGDPGHGPSALCPVRDRGDPDRHRADRVPTSAGARAHRRCRERMTAP